jgi:hypothetical protein
MTNELTKLHEQIKAAIRHFDLVGWQNTDVQVTTRHLAFALETYRRDSDPATKKMLAKYYAEAERAWNGRDQ